MLFLILVRYYMFVVFSSDTAPLVADVAVVAIVNDVAVFFDSHRYKNYMHSFVMMNYLIDYSK